MRSDKARPAERIMAANSILDRAFGRPKQTADVRLRTNGVRELSDEDLMAIAMSAEAPERLH